MHVKLNKLVIIEYILEEVDKGAMILFYPMLETIAHSSEMLFLLSSSLLLKSLLSLSYFKFKSDFKPFSL